MAARSPRLIDIRQLGPNREREISGVCSVCDAVLLARLKQEEGAPLPEQLHARLARLFESHIQKEHQS